MGQRSVRVNELVKREISDFLHSRYRDQTVRITIVEADISPDLRNGRIYYSVLGDEVESREAEAFLQQKKNEIRRHLGRNVILKYTPSLQFIEDDALERGSRVLDLLDEIEQEDDPNARND